MNVVHLAKSNVFNLVDTWLTEFRIGRIRVVLQTGYVWMFKPVCSGWPKAIWSIQNSVNPGPMFKINFNITAIILIIFVFAGTEEILKVDVTIAVMPLSCTNVQGRTKFLTSTKTTDYCRLSAIGAASTCWPMTELADDKETPANLKKSFSTQLVELAVTKIVLSLTAQLVVTLKTSIRY